MGKICAVGTAILLINFMGPPRYLLSQSISGPEICREMARDYTPFAVRFHFEVPRCLIEIPAIKGDKSK